MSILKRIRCWLTKKHVWGKPFELVGASAYLGRESYVKKCRRCDKTMPVKRRAKK